MRSLTQVLVNLLIILLVIWAGWRVEMILSASDERRFSFPKSEKTWTVNAQSFSPQVYQPDIQAYGRIKPRQDLAIRAEVGGTILRLGPGVAEGVSLKQGELIAEIDPISLKRQVEQIALQIAETQTQIDEAQLNRRLLAEQRERDTSQLALADQDLKRQQDLLKRGFSTQAQVDQARRAQLNAEQSLFARDQAIEQNAALITRLGKSQQRLETQKLEAEDQLAKTSITAPHDGILTGLAVATGESINAAAVLGRLQDTRQLDVEFELTEADFARFIDARTGENRLIGSPVSLIWQPGITPIPYQARVERFSPGTEATTASVLVYARIALTPHQAPPPLDSFVAVSLPGEPFEGVVRVPQTTLHAGGRVFAITPERRLATMEAQRLRDEGETLVLRIPGMDSDTCLMTTNLPLAGEGIKVKLVGDPTPGGQSGGPRGRPGGARGAPGETADVQKPGLLVTVLRFFIGIELAESLLQGEPKPGTASEGNADARQGKPERGPRDGTDGKAGRQDSPLPPPCTSPASSTSEAAS